MQIQPNDLLLIIDVQNDFCPGGALAVADGDAVVPVINRLIERFDHVVLTQDWHPSGHSSFASSHPGAAPFETIAMPYGPQTLWPDHCVQGTTGAEFHPDLQLPSETTVVSKGMDPDDDAYSCFQGETSDGMPFAAALGERGAGRLFIGGLATDYCVKATALDALKEGFEVVVLADAVRAVDVTPGDGERALAAMQQAGARLVRLDDLG